MTGCASLQPLSDLDLKHTAAVAASTPLYSRPVNPGESGQSPSGGTDWLAALRSSGPRRDKAVADLHALLLRASRFELGRRRAALSHVRGEELEDLALQAADDALVAILAKLDQYRGASRFTTWAYKFALLEAGVKVRRRAWQGHEVVLASEAWDGFTDAQISAQGRLEQGELLEHLAQAIREALTPHQRDVFVALSLNEVPIDVLAERLGTSRGSLYKTLHDARAKLRRALASEGYMDRQSEPVEES
jgi:RNA polymerase sigma-70 factor, ECF subfamily